MKKNKSKRILIVVIIVLLGIYSFEFYQYRIITNKEDKISLVYNLLDDASKQIVNSKCDSSKQAEIKKLIITKSNRRYTAVNEKYYNKTVYEITFPIRDGAETEFKVLCNLDLTNIVGYGVIE